METLKDSANDRPSAEEFADYCIQFGILLSWGIPIVDLLMLLEKGVTSPLIGRLIGDQIQSIRDSTTLDPAFRKHPWVSFFGFPSVVATGEEQGNLNEALVTAALKIDPAVYVRLGRLLCGSDELCRVLGKVADKLGRRKKLRIAFDSAAKICTDRRLKDWLVAACSVATQNERLSDHVAAGGREIFPPVLRTLLAMATRRGELEDLLKDIFVASESLK